MAALAARRDGGLRKRHGKELTRSKRYYRYCLTYRYKFLLFILDHVSPKKKPTYQQMPLILDMSQPNFKMSTVSGHSPGKTWVIAWYIIWQTTVYPYSTIQLSAPKLEQLQKAIWRELSKNLDEFYLVRPWLECYFVKQTKYYFARGCRESWAASLGTAPKGREDNLSGMHGEKHTVILDEAAGISEALLGILVGSLSGTDNSLAMFGQGLRPNGPFYDSHHSHKDIFSTHILDSELTPPPLVNKDWIEMMLVRYGGFFSDEYQIKIKGGWPTSMEGRLIPRAWAELCGDVAVKHEQAPGYVIAVDVAGTGRNSTVYLVAKVSGYRKKRFLETVELIIEEGVNKAPHVVRRIKGLYRQYKRFSPKVGVDAGGAGGPVCDYLVEGENPIPVIRIHWGSPALEKERYGNQRVEWAYWVREAVQYNRITFKGVSRNTKTKIYDQFGNVPYRYTDKNLYLWSKERMKDNGIASPDIFDVYCFAYYLPFTAMIMGDDDDSRLAAAMAKAKADLEKFEKQFEEDD